MCPTSTNIHTKLRSNQRYDDLLRMLAPLQKSSLMGDLTSSDLTLFRDEEEFEEEEERGGSTYERIVLIFLGHPTFGPFIGRKGGVTKMRHPDHCRR